MADRTPRKLHFLGDGDHAETSLATANDRYAVEVSPLDLTQSYRQSYALGVYSDPRSAVVDPDAQIDTTSMDVTTEPSISAADADICPCAGTL